MGKLIVIEGLDGAGKGTQSARLVAFLKEQGKKVRLIDFPCYGEDSSVLVRMYLNGALGTSPDDTNAYAASMFFAADRYVSYKTDWQKDVDDPDTVVIANRYTTANAYHQLAKLPREQWDAYLAWLWDFEFSKLGLPKPDAVIGLTMPPKVSRSLVEKRCAEQGIKKDIHEADAAYLSRCYEALCFVGEKMHWSLIDCSDGVGILSIEEIEEKIHEALSL